MKGFPALLAALALTVSLAGCTTPTVNPPATSPDPSPVVDPADDTVFRISGIPASSTLLTVDGTPVSAEVYMYWLLYTTSYYESYMQYYGQTLDWGEEMDGQTLAEFLKNDARDAVKFYSLLAARADELSCGLNDEQLAQLATDRADMIEQLGGEDEYAFNLRYAGISEDTLTILNSTSYLYENLVNHFFGGDNTPTQDDYDQFIDEQGILWAKHILLSTVDASGAVLEPEALEAVTAQAEDLLAQLLAAGDNQAALFDDLMNQYSEDPGLATAPDGYMFGPGEMVASFESATAALEPGQMADYLVESDYGYHIILRLPRRYDAELHDRYTQFHFDALTTLWMENAVVEETEAFTSLETQPVYEAMTAFRAELEAEHNDAE